MPRGCKRYYWEAIFHQSLSSQNLGGKLKWPRHLYKRARKWDNYKRTESPKTPFNPCSHRNYITLRCAHGIDQHSKRSGQLRLWPDLLRSYHLFLEQPLLISVAIRAEAKDKLLFTQWLSRLANCWPHRSRIRFLLVERLDALHHHRDDNGESHAFSNGVGGSTFVSKNGAPLKRPMAKALFDLAQALEQELTKLQAEKLQVGCRVQYWDIVAEYS